MSAIPPPPIAIGIEEVYEVTVESERALQSLEAFERAQHERPARPRSPRSWLGLLAGLALLGAASAAVAIGGGLVMRRRRNKGLYRLLRKPWMTFAGVVNALIVRKMR